MKGETVFSSLKRLELKRAQIYRLNLSLWILLALLSVIAVGDLARAALKPELPLDPVIPYVEDLGKPLVEVPLLDLPEALFQPAAAPKEEPTQPTVPQAPKVQWKLLGVSLGETKRAFLQDPEGKQSAWVSEGERIGTSLVKEIRERSIVLEEGGTTFEIRL